MESVAPDINDNIVQDIAETTDDDHDADCKPTDMKIEIQKKENLESNVVEDVLVSTTLCSNIPSVETPNIDDEASCISTEIDKPDDENLNKQSDLVTINEKQDSEERDHADEEIKLISVKISDNPETNVDDEELLEKDDINCSPIKLTIDLGLKSPEEIQAETVLEHKLSESIISQSEDCILEPLSFPEKQQDQEITEEASLIEFKSNFDSDETPCMLCDNLYKDIREKSQNDEYLCHLVVEHKLVIADVKLISDLRSYAIYWKKRFAEESIDTFCASINTNMSPKDMHESEKYYLLCDALAEDRKLRESLQLAKLKELIAIQTKERENDEFERICLFCTKFFIGNRAQLFNHLNQDHNFNVGHPHNLIHVEEFLDEIERKLNSLECLFCDKVFKDRASLREHMRKKSHRRLNPKNKIYDKYYIINYLELGKNWEVLQGESDQLESPEDWSGWESEGVAAVCFFCSAAFSTQDRVFDHMREVHEFDFPQMRKDMNLSFYQQVKMINYIRRVVHQVRGNEKKEKRAEEDSENKPLLTANNIAKSVKGCILSSTKWNQPQYYFPTYENDNLLCQLEDKEGLFEPEDNFIIGEDGIDCKGIINGSVLTDLVVQGYFD